MTYRHENRVNSISFGPGHRFEGLNLKTRSIKVAQFVALGSNIGSIQAAGTSDDPETVLAAARDAEEAMNRAKELFAGALIEWDFELDDKLVPCTVAGLELLDDETVMELITEWAQALSTPAPSLGKGSSSGASSLEASIPMEVWSENRAS